MLKTTGSLEKSAPKTFRTGNNEVVRGGGGRVNKIVVNSSKFKNEKSRKPIHILNIGAMRKPNFLTPNAKKAVNHLWLAFIKAPIL